MGYAGESTKHVDADSRIDQVQDCRRIRSAGRVRAIGDRRAVRHHMIKIDAVNPDGWQLWRNLRLAALRDAPEVFGAELADWQADNDTEQRWRDRLCDVEVNYVAYVDEQPAGMLSGNRSADGRAVELISLWVDPHVRGRGIADTLIDAVLRWAGTQLLINRAVAQVRPTNWPARKLFERKLFERNAHQTISAPDATDVVELVRRLRHRRRIGLHSGQQYPDFGSIRSLWSRAETLGYDWVSVFDHYRPPILGPDGPCLDGLTSLSALAAVTTRVRCGMLVASPTWRHPALAAIIAATIDHVSGGRLEFGLGLGGRDLAFNQYEIPQPHQTLRAGQLEETCKVLRLLWQGGPVDFSGTHYQLREAYLNPRPVQRRIPLIIGGLGEQYTLPIAAQYADIWNTIALPPEAYRHKNQFLEQQCFQHGRDPAEIRRSLTFRAVIRNGDTTCNSALPHAADRLECLSVGNAGKLIDRLGVYADLGVDDFVLAVRPPIDLETVERFAFEVAPTLQASETPA